MSEPRGAALEDIVRVSRLGPSAPRRSRNVRAFVSLRRACCACLPCARPQPSPVSQLLGQLQLGWGWLVAQLLILVAQSVERSPSVVAASGRHGERVRSACRHRRDRHSAQGRDALWQERAALLAVAEAEPASAAVPPGKDRAVSGGECDRVVLPGGDGASVHRHQSLDQLWRVPVEAVAVAKLAVCAAAPGEDLAARGAGEGVASAAREVRHARVRERRNQPWHRARTVLVGRSSELALRRPAPGVDASDSRPCGRVVPPRSEEGHLLGREGRHLRRGSNTPPSRRGGVSTDARRCPGAVPGAGRQVLLPRVAVPEPELLVGVLAPRPEQPFSRGCEAVHAARRDGTDPHAAQRLNEARHPRRRLVPVAEQALAPVAPRVGCAVRRHRQRVVPPRRHRHHRPRAERRYGARRRHEGRCADARRDDSLRVAEESGGAVGGRRGEVGKVIPRPLRPCREQRPATVEQK
mmetsp:Transcript_11469/g.33779  ORF Transcript_11469/g.33779 Transcript_11469/m.33779 type:complete len:467 (-) Transcript_11469:438-1838(-)